ncbi:ecto-ADP-ribosyltransferase 5-like [Pelobates cultripes]|uniref:NAD(P)(+)--arginine ADP-ribosyltransferase n=1 Tax=Pelobates cultripes TaxID=61616 RepID=A0AAD1VN33_PELCU|nr:ecto-ADP-ribosyltransferase 5-like [Pelobates cultripes]
MFEPSNGSDIVKFGQFLSPFLDDGTSYSNKSFTLTSCFGVSIQNFSQYPLENTVVVPGYEVFNLENEGSTFSLNSTGKKCSNYNCAYVRGDKSRLSLDHCISGLSLERSTLGLPLDSSTPGLPLDSSTPGLPFNPSIPGLSWDYSIPKFSWNYKIYASDNEDETNMPPVSHYHSPSAPNQGTSQTVCVCFPTLEIPLLKIKCEILDMMANTFDDQYIGCEEKMEKVAPSILQKEKNLYKKFQTGWDYAEDAWRTIKPKLNNKPPTGFKDEYGTAIVLYTLDKQYKIYHELNNNISIAGQSTKYYMNNFHFKAFHFYLTRALQLLGRRCNNTTYRGSPIFYSVSQYMRFGRFASSSLNKDTAKGFGTATFFTITTFFGVDIQDLSDFEEQEILIPVYEKFEKKEQNEKDVTITSTGEKCSYFNCAYFGCTKRTKPFCNSGTKSTDPVCSSAHGGGLSGFWIWMIFTGLTLVHRWV